MKLLFASCLLLAACIAMLFTACKDGNIFYTLENEDKVVDLSLPNDVSVFDVAKIGTSYYAAAGKIWTVTAADLVSGAGWDIEATVAPPVAGGICTALVASPFGTNTLFGGFIRSAGGLGLYESDATPSFAGQPLISFGTLNVPAAAQVALLKVVDHPAEELAVVATLKPPAGSDYEFWLVTRDITGVYEELDLTRASGEQKKSINDVIWSILPTPDAWFATEGGKLYSGPSGGPLTVVASLESITGDETLVGLFDDGTNIYVASQANSSSASSAVYYSADGSTWNRLEVPQEGDGTYPPLTRFAGKVDSGYLLVGSDGYGYYRLNTADLGGADPLTRYPTTTSDLYAAAVQKIYFDAVEDRLFACTQMGGLWRGEQNLVDPDDPLIESDWNWE